MNFISFCCRYFGFLLVVFGSNLALNTYELYLRHAHISASSLLSSDLLKYSKTLAVLIMLSMLYMLVAFCLRRFSRLMHIVLWGGVFANGALIILDLFLLINFHSFINQFLLDALFRTNAREAGEFVGAYVSGGFVAMAVGSIVIMYILARYIRLNILAPKRVNITICAVLAIIALITIADTIKKQITTKTTSYTYIRLEGFAPTRLAVAFLCYHEGEYTDYKALTSAYKQLKLSHPPIKAKEGIKNIVLVIGESLAREHMQLYGHKLDSTPNLVRLENSGHLIAYTDTIAPYASTNPVMQVLLNFSNYESKVPWHKHLDIVSLFSLAGYKTHFISNQEGFGTFGNAAASVGAGADFVYFSNAYKNSIMFMNFRPDSVLLEPIDNLELDERNFIIIHLMGSHFIYAYRYEDRFAKFGADKCTDERCKEIAHYHNSVLYNDYILSKIYERFSGEDSLVVYLSDHGEALYDDKSGTIIGHSIVDASNAKIPLVFMYSDEFARSHKALLDRIAKNKDKAYMSDDLIHTMCDIAGLDASECDMRRSVINESFDTHRTRIFQGVDYDKELK